MSVLQKCCDKSNQSLPTVQCACGNYFPVNVHLFGMNTLVVSVAHFVAYIYTKEICCVITNPTCLPSELLNYFCFNLIS